MTFFFFPETSGMSLTGAIDIFAFGEIPIQSKFAKIDTQVSYIVKVLEPLFISEVCVLSK